MMFVKESSCSVIIQQIMFRFSGFFIVKKMVILIVTDTEFSLNLLVIIPL